MFVTLPPKFGGPKTLAVQSVASFGLNDLGIGHQVSATSFAKVPTTHHHISATRASSTFNVFKLNFNVFKLEPP